MKLHRHHGTAAGFLVFAALVAAVSAIEFNLMRSQDRIVPGSGVTRTDHLSTYAPSLRESSGDTPIFIFEGDRPGGTMLVLGGVHPNEASGFIAAVLLVENAMVTRGRLLVIPQASLSGYTCTDPMEAYPQHYTIRTPHGTRAFRYGSRGMNPVDQWPDPLVYLHYPSGQRLSGIETRNLNRNFPGRSDGTFTEQVAHGIMEILRRENVTIAVDLHEAAPEYPVINALVTHEKGEEIAASAVLDLELNDLQFTLELSPTRFRGLSHREWGDATQAIPFLMETGNIMQGRLRGRTEPDLIVSGKDKMYLRAADIGMVKIPYDSTGVPLKRRVGRHLQGILSLLQAYNESAPDNPIILQGVPAFDDLMEKGIGVFLHPTITQEVSKTESSDE